MPIFYTAVSRFDATCGRPWHEFIKWSGLAQLHEVISLDAILCPAVIRELTTEDWEHNVQEDYLVHFFWDLEYFVQRVAGCAQANILALMQNPMADDIASFVDPRFVFRGFDLIERDSGISALVNCGGFDKAFSPSDISDCGLLTDHAKALSTQKLLLANYPDEDHADCDVWALWQMKLDQ